MLRFRLTFTMVARHLSNDLDLAAVETGEIFGIANDVIGMQVVLCVGNEKSYVVQNARRLQVFAIDAVELVKTAQLVEKRESQFGNLVRMIFFVLAAFGEMQHSFIADVC